MRRIAEPLQPQIEKRQTRLMPWQSHTGGSFRKAPLSEPNRPRQVHSERVAASRCNALSKMVHHTDADTKELDASYEFG